MDAGLSDKLRAAASSPPVKLVEACYKVCGRAWRQYEVMTCDPKGKRAVYFFDGGVGSGDRLVGIARGRHDDVYLQAAIGIASECLLRDPHRPDQQPSQQKPIMSLLSPLLDIVWGGEALLMGRESNIRIDIQRGFQEPKYVEGTLSNGDSYQVSADFLEIDETTTVFNFCDRSARPSRVLLCKHTDGSFVALSDGKFGSELTDKLIRACCPEAGIILQKTIPADIVIARAPEIKEMRRRRLCGPKDLEETLFPSLKSFALFDDYFLTNYGYNGQEFSVQGTIKLDKERNRYIVAASGPGVENRESSLWLLDSLRKVFELECPDLGCVVLTYSPDEDGKAMDMLPSLTETVIDGEAGTWQAVLKTKGKSFLCRATLHSPSQTLVVSGPDMGHWSNDSLRLLVADEFQKALPNSYYNGAVFRSQSRLPTE